MKDIEKMKKQNAKGWRGKLMRSKKGYTGSILPFFMFNIILMFALYIFVADADNPYKDNTFMESFLDFTNWGAECETPNTSLEDCAEGSESYIGWLVLALGTGSAVLISAAILGWKSEFPIFAGWSMIIWGTFAPTYTQYYNQAKELVGGTNDFLAMLFLAPIAVGWLMVVIEFSRGRD